MKKYKAPELKEAKRRNTVPVPIMRDPIDTMIFMIVSFLVPKRKIAMSKGKKIRNSTTNNTDIIMYVF